MRVLMLGAGSHAQLAAALMQRLEPICLEVKPDVVLVYGDVNSTMAAALVAAKLGIKVGHVEAGLRSRDWSMPEEINPVVNRLVAARRDALLSAARDVTRHSNGRCAPPAIERWDGFAARRIVAVLCDEARFD